MWKTIGGFVVSNVAEMFAKELVKEISNPSKLAVPQRTAQTGQAPNKPTTRSTPYLFKRPQVMVFEWDAERKEGNQRTCRNR